MINNRQIEAITSHLKSFRKRMVVHDLWEIVQDRLWLVALILAALLIAGRFIPIRSLEILLLAPLSLFMIFIFVKLITLPKSDLQVAWRIDKNLKLKERISTAIAISKSQGSIDIESQILFQKQNIDALEQLRGLDPRIAFKLGINFKKWLAVILFLSIAVVLVILPNPMDAILQAREEVAKVSANEADSIEEQAEEIRNDSQLSDEEKEEILRDLESLAAQLRENKGDLAEALESISSAEQSLLKNLDPNADFKRSTLDSISNQLAALANQASSDEDEFAGINEALSALIEEMSDMTENERQELSNSLQRMAAQAARAGAPSLSESLSALGKAALNGSIEQAQDAAQNAREASSQLENQLNGQQSLESALAQLQESRTALSQSSQSAIAASAQNGEQNSSGQGETQGGEESQGSGQGQGQGQSSTVAGGGGGTSADSLPPSSGAGQAQDPEGPGQSTDAELLGDQVFVPWENLQAINDTLSISGQDTGQGDTQVSEFDQPLPGTNLPSIIPYQEVFKNYQNTAFETIENSYIPPGLKDYIRAYFTRLEP